MSLFGAPQVIVVANPTTNEVVTPNAKKPEFGTIRLESSVVESNNGFWSTRKRVVFIGGRLAELEALNLRDKQVIGGQIIKQESFRPFYTGQQCKINPNKNNEIVYTDGKPTYLNFLHTMDMSKHDEWVENLPKESTAVTPEVTTEANFSTAPTTGADPAQGPM